MLPKVDRINTFFTPEPRMGVASLDKKMLVVKEMTKMSGRGETDGVWLHRSGAAALCCRCWEARRGWIPENWKSCMASTGMLVMSFACL